MTRTAAALALGLVDAARDVTLVAISPNDRAACQRARWPPWIVAGSAGVRGAF